MKGKGCLIAMQAIDKKKMELMKIAYLYYIKGHSQEEISELLQKSKMTVSRMTRKAIEEGIVKISVQLPYQVNEELQEKLLRTFGLKDVVVAKNIIGEELSLFLGGVGAYGLLFHLKNGDVLGVGESYTVNLLAKSLIPHSYKNLRVVQLLGALEGHIRPDNSFLTTKEIAQKLDGQGYSFSAPAKVNDKQIKKMLLSNSPTFERIKQLWEECNIAVIGIGTVNREVQEHFLNQEELQELEARGAVGDILGFFYNIDGEIVNADMEDYLMGISRERLFKIEKLIAIAGGPEKATAIIGALRTGAVDILITDEETAEKVYAQALS
jgi:deoxyribonucleoside regulator